MEVRAPNCRVDRDLSLRLSRLSRKHGRKYEV